MLIKAQIRAGQHRELPPAGIYSPDRSGLDPQGREMLQGRGCCEGTQGRDPHPLPTAPTALPREGFDASDIKKKRQNSIKKVLGGIT